MPLTTPVLTTPPHPMAALVSHHDISADHVRLAVSGAADRAESFRRKTRSRPSGGPRSHGVMWCRTSTPR